MGQFPLASPSEGAPSSPSATKILTPFTLHEMKQQNNIEKRSVLLKLDCCGITLPNSLEFNIGPGHILQGVVS